MRSRTSSRAGGTGGVEALGGILHQGHEGLMTEGCTGSFVHFWVRASCLFDGALALTTAVDSKGDQTCQSDGSDDGADDGTDGRAGTAGHGAATRGGAETGSGLSAVRGTVVAGGEVLD